MLAPTRSLLALVACALLAGCMREPESPKRDSGGGVEDVQAQLDRAESDLHQALVASEGEEAEAHAPGPAAGTEAKPTPYAEKQTKSPQERRCTTACRALVSMNRAATRLCDLAGAEDTRCGGAKNRLAAARDLVRKSCPTCS